MSGVQTRGTAALEAEQAEVDNLLVGGQQIEQDELLEDLVGVDTASDDVTDARVPSPDPPDYLTAVERTYRQVMQEQEGMEQAGQLTKDAGLMMHILSQRFHTAIERT